MRPLSMLAVLLAALPLAAQSDPLSRSFVPRTLTTSPDAWAGGAALPGDVLFRQELDFGRVPWVQLRFSSARLGRGNVLRVTSIEDGAEQHLSQSQLMGQWQGHTAYFNGGHLLVEVVSGARSSSARPSLVLQGAWVGGGEAVFESICGLDDDRELSAHPHVGKILPIGCTGFVTDRVCGSAGFGRWHLSAGHCVAGPAFSVLAFDVPLSNPDCSWRMPHPDDQYAIDPFSIASENVAVGADWSAFCTFPNSNTGLFSHQAQGGGLALAESLPVNGVQLSVFGYGNDGNAAAGGGGDDACSCSETSGTGTYENVQQRSLGSLLDVQGSVLTHDADTCSGNSGSPILWREAVIGVHTHGGCDTVGTNAATSITHAPLQSALVGPVAPVPALGTGAVLVLASAVAMLGAFLFARRRTA